MCVTSTRFFPDPTIRSRPVKPGGQLAAGGKFRFRIQEIAGSQVVIAFNLDAQPQGPLDTGFRVPEVVFFIEIFAGKIGVRLGIESPFGP